ncbi:MAG TPA: aldehyde dehydrogenase family protein [Thermoanaerobaculia bacterium]|nr:aldehyde dehydrogenase family protein [Thermoanaerobaculia bacterium]
MSQSPDRLPHLPVLRLGKAETPYRSLTVETLRDVRTGRPVAEVSQANRGLIAHDLHAAERGRQALQEIPVPDLLEICRKAAALFSGAELPLEAGGPPQSFEDYIRQLSSTTGLPVALCRFNAEKVRAVLDGMAEVLSGLTRGLDLSVLDAGWGWQDGRRVSYVGQTDSLGAVLPSNSPGVHTLWLPAFALKVPVILKPGREEPWTPFRVTQAMIAAGLPQEAVAFYPTDHGGATEVLLRCGRSLLFGDGDTVRPWREDPRVQIHGPGRSKVIFGLDQAERWQSHLDVLATSIAENGGRSCLNASGVWLPKEAGVGRELAEALAQKLAAIPARALDDPEARLAAFAKPAVAHRLSEWIDRMLRIPGAVDLTAEVRGASRVASRVVELDGCTFLLPTLVWCEDPEHPLADTEMLFPFASVVEVPRAELLRRVGSTLVGTVLTEDARFEREVLDCPWIDRLNFGPVPTSRISWDQPHEGNLFLHLYRQRAFQMGMPAAPPVAAAAGTLMEARA